MCSCEGRCVVSLLMAHQWCCHPQCLISVIYLHPSRVLPISHCADSVRRSEIYRERSGAAASWNEPLLYSPCATVTHSLSGMLIYEVRLLFILPHRVRFPQGVVYQSAKRDESENYSAGVKWLKWAPLSKQLVCFYWLDRRRTSEAKCRTGQLREARQGPGPNGHILLPWTSALLCLTG